MFNVQTAPMSSEAPTLRHSLIGKGPGFSGKGLVPHMTTPRAQAVTSPKKSPGNDTYTQRNVDISEAACEVTAGLSLSDNPENSPSHPQGSITPDTNHFSKISALVLRLFLPF